jgi:hypothetical protein
MRKLSSRPLGRPALKKAPPSAADADKQRKDQAAINIVLRNPRYSAIVLSLREGQSVPDIAKWFATNGWLDVSERTFSAALNTFRAKNIHLLTSDATHAPLDALMEANRPGVDVEAELNRLYRLQKERISIDVAHERTMRKLLPTTAKEFLVAAEFLDKLAKIKGLGGSVSASEGDSFASFPADVRDTLRGIKAEEAQASRLHMITHQIAEKVLGSSYDKKDDE